MQTTEKKQILVVEQNASEAAALQRLIEDAGYGCLSARDGREGLAVVVKDCPALVITSAMLPVMDGYTMCSEIKKNSARGNTPIPVILLTRLTEPEDIMKGLSCGADDYIAKPFDLPHLLLKIEALLNEPAQFHNKPDEKGIVAFYGGKKYMIHSGRGQALAFLLSTCESAIRQSKDYKKTQDQLILLNARLEQSVREKTAKLDSEFTGRKAAEESCKESAEMFRTVIESASDAIIALDAPGKISMWNKKAEAVFGYTAAEALGMDFHSLIVPERYRDAAYAGLSAFFQNGAGKVVGKTLEIDALRRDGTEFPIELSISAFKAYGRWAAIGIIRDITERKALEARTAQTFDEMERLNRLMVGRELKMEELRAEVRALMERIRELEGIKAD